MFCSPDDNFKPLFRYTTKTPKAGCPPKACVSIQLLALILGLGAGGDEDLYLYPF
ncbi:MAG: hypothetical protein CM15mP103_06240 [Gammaproteobacteria bacterium]|nr:MAG: hypothetical protein CM15mP103_06240 [Gammaproteobacteria bacterium]